MSARRLQSGMSLVELMVGMLIGLIGIVIITHLYLTNEQYKRSTTGAGSAQVNGAIALYTLERDIRMAGYGMNHSGALGCSCVGAGCSPVQYYYSGTYSYPPAGSATGALPPLNFAPAVIASTAGTPDTITLLYGNAPERALPGSLTENMPNSSSVYKVDGTAGFRTGDMVLVTQGSSCVLTQVTAVNAPSSHLNHAPGTSNWNPPGAGSLPAFTQGALLFNMGTPTWRSYSIANNKLRLTEVLIAVAGGAAVDIMDDIVDLQAQYGKDTDANGVVDVWNTTAPASAADWQQVIALRVAVLARNSNYERPSVAGGACQATTVNPTWSGHQASGAAGDAFTIPGGLPSCYKYRVFETIVPLRNMIWRPI